MRQLLGQYVLTALGLFGGIIALFQFKETYFDQGRPDQRLALIILGFFSSFFFCESLYFRIRWGRDSKYGASLDLVNKAFATLHALQINEETQADRVVSTMNQFCTYIARAYSRITGSKCSVCIKLLKKEEHEESKQMLLSIVTAFRDEHSLEERSNPSNKPPPKHFVHLNSDFSRIIRRFKNPYQRYFLSNNLPFFWSYENTSFQVYGEPSDITFPVFSHLMRNWRWPLPYKSTMVVPICALTSKSEEDIVGFLCIDSPQRGVFKKSYDLDLAKGVADGLSPKIKLLQDNQELISTHE